MLKCTKIREYMKNGKPRFVYAVSGSKEELAKYKKIQGEYYREDDKTGAPIYNTGRAFIQKTGNLGFTFDGTGVYQDQSELNELKSIAEQTGANLGDILLKARVDQMLNGNSAPAPTAPVAEDTQDVSKL